MDHFFKRIISTVILITLVSVWHQVKSSELSTADSLFNNQKYTEAFEKYENIFIQNTASPAMLTRMAFIQEGLGNYSDALYYLNLYFLKTSDKTALSKMRELATQHNLEGYEYSDTQFLLNFLRKHQTEIILCLSVFSLFLLAYGFNKRRKEENPGISLVLQMMVLILIGSIINNLFFKQKAIISKDNSVLMSGPSAGAEPVNYIKKGNKVSVLESDALWTKIHWSNSEVYIRSKNLQIL